MIFLGSKVTFAVTSIMDVQRQEVRTGDLILSYALSLPQVAGASRSIDSWLTVWFALSNFTGSSNVQRSCLESLSRAVAIWEGCHETLHRRPLSRSLSLSSIIYDRGVWRIATEKLKEQPATGSTSTGNINVRRARRVACRSDDDLG